MTQSHKSLKRTNGVRKGRAISSDLVGPVARDQYARDLARVREGEEFFVEIGRIQRERIHG
jgi:hypothetical protein